MRVPSGGYSCTLDGDFIKRLAGGFQHYRSDAQVDHPAHNDIAVGGRDLAPVTTATQDVRRSHAGPRSHEAIKNAVARIGVGFHEELHEGARERCGVGALSAL